MSSNTPFSVSVFEDKQYQSDGRIEETIYIEKCTGTACSFAEELIARQAEKLWEHKSDHTKIKGATTPSALKQHHTNGNRSLITGIPNQSQLKYDRNCHPGSRGTLQHVEHICTPTTDAKPQDCN